MKKIKFHFIIVCILIYTSLFSQNQFHDRNQAVMFGYNFVNDNYFNDSDLFDNKNWGYDRALVLGHVISLNNKFNLNSQLSNNGYRKWQNVNGKVLTTSGNVFSADVNLQYDISSLDNDTRNNLFRFIKPYITIGIGGTIVDQDIINIAYKERLTLNYGLGGYIWFDSKSRSSCNCRKDFFNNLGIFTQVVNKSSFQQGSYGQFTFGLIYRY